MCIHNAAHFFERASTPKRYYAGDPVQMGASLYKMWDHAALLAMVDRALSLPSERETKP